MKEPPRFQSRFIGNCVEAHWGPSFVSRDFRDSRLKNDEAAVERSRLDELRTF